MLLVPFQSIHYCKSLGINNICTRLLNDLREILSKCNRIKKVKIDFIKCVIQLLVSPEINWYEQIVHGNKLNRIGDLQLSNDGNKVMKRRHLVNKYTENPTDIPSFSPSVSHSHDALRHHEGEQNGMYFLPVNACIGSNVIPIHADEQWARHCPSISFEYSWSAAQQLDWAATVYRTN